MHSAAIEVTPRIMGNRLEVGISGALASIIYDWRGEPDWSLPRPRTDDYALLAALAWAMKRGGRLHVKGRVDQRLLAGAEKFCEIWAAWRPDLFKPLRVSADEECGPVACESGAGHAFALSGGLDSVFSLMRNAERSDGRVTRRPGAAYLMAWRGDGAVEDEWSARVRGRAKTIAEVVGAPFYVCATNWRAFSTDFFMDHALGIIAAAHCLNSSTSGCVLAADATYVNEYRLAPLGNNHTTNPLLSSSGFEVLGYGGAFERMEKMKLVAARPDLLSEVVVCHAKPKGRANCGRCEKCVRTGLELFAVTGDTKPILEALPSPWTLAWMKPMSLSSVVFWRDMLRHWPRGHAVVRAGVDILLWRSMLQRHPIMRLLKAAEVNWFRGGRKPKPA